jgi:serine phosphatase RsbU (regulator of sigma subunit)
MGKGAAAAALMGQVRSAIRAYAVAGQSPTEVLTSLDHLFDALVEDRVVTVVVGTINPATGWCS